jgi:histidinol phosphatase-like PHP family hydrolase
MSLDTNAVVAGALRDLAAVQWSPQSRWGYKRAASAVARLERQLPDLIGADGVLPPISGIGPASTRVIVEVLASGWSETVERAIAVNDKAAEIRTRRALRTHFLSRAEALRILQLDVPGVVSLADYRGDFQMHSTWSDGVDSISDLAAAAVARAYTHIAITDHSKGLPIARGMSVEAMAAQAREIDAVNRHHAGAFRVLRGIETNISAAGDLDLTAAELAGVEMVLAAPHSKLRTPDDQTARLVRAVSIPEVHVLAHPRGRMSDSRPGVTADWDDVFAAAVEHDVAIEIDGDPARQDLDYTYAHRACEAGCLFSLDSDAHDTHALVYAETALAHARLAGIPAERVINCWPLPRVLGWVASKRRNACNAGTQLAESRPDKKEIPRHGQH